MGNRTETTTVILGGALATLLLWLFGPWLAAHGRELTPGVEAALTTLVIAVLAYLLPAELLARVRRRTRPPRGES